MFGTNIKRAFMSKIGFLKWAQLHPDDVKTLLAYEEGYSGRVFLSPDVHSLHIVWEEIGNPDEKLWHEIQDYFGLFAETPVEFLNAHVFDDAQGPIGWTDDVYRVISDFGKVTPADVKIVRLAELV
jgi:hypothetical protein